MKKIFSLVVAALLLAFFTTGANAATKAKTASYDKGIMGVQGIGDLSSGDTAEVDANGSLRTKEFTKSTNWTHGDQNDALSGSAIIYGFTVTGASAGDEIILVDAATVPTAYTDSTAVKLEAKIDTNNGSFHVPVPGGVEFSTGVSIDATDADVHCILQYSSY